ncbi:MAG: DUF5615 family PIN-like protein [Bacteroidia bacterium]
MKFLVDAQLPFVLSLFLERRNFDVIHTDNLPNKERTSDTEIREISVKENRIVITKDSDFVDSYYLKGIPQKILLISTGNISNKDLLEILARNIDLISEMFLEYSFIELDNFNIKGHE